MVDTLDLGSSAFARGGSSPSSRTQDVRRRMTLDVNVSVEEKGEISRDITMAIPRGEFDAQFNSRLKRAAVQAQIKGFRAGKAPLNVVRKLYGGQIQSDVMGELIDKAYRQAIEEHSLEVVGRPDFDIAPLEDEKDLQVKVSVELYPRPELADYQGLKVEVEKIEEEEDAVEKQLDRMLDSFSEHKPIEGRTKVENGDIALVVYEATIEEKPFDKSDEKGARIEVGSGQFPEDLEKALIGAELEETREILVKVPDTIADPEVAGKDALYIATVKSLFEKVRPEVSDEFVKEKGLGDTVSEVREKIAESIEAEGKRKREQELETKLFEAIIEKSPFEMPQVLVDEEIRTILFEARLLDPSKQESYQFDMTQFRERLGKGAEFRARRRIVLERVIDKEEIKANKEDVEKWLSEKSEEMDRPKEEVEKLYDFPNSTGRLIEMLVGERALKHLTEAVEVSEVS